MKPCYLIEYAIFAFVICNAYGQRVAPGVPPQQYQHVPVQHHQQMQYQQVPVQQQQYHQPEVQYQQPDLHQQQIQYQQPVVQQVPQQQQQQHHPQVPPQQHHPQVPPVQQQVPVAQAHGQGHAHGHHAPQQVLNANVQQERAHIQEHMDVPIDTSKMSEQELQFHYFKMHDSDNNNKLDGCELIKSLIHWHEQGSKESHHQDKPHVEEKLFSDEELVALIDPILQTDDTSRDGFIDYVEFIKAQQKVAAQNVKPGK